MIPKSLKIRSSLLWLGLLLTLASGSVQAQFVVNGFGLSGSGTVLDSAVAPGENIYVLLTVDVPAGWRIQGVGQESRPNFQISGYFYSEVEPEGEPEGLEVIEVDSTQFAVDTTENPRVVFFVARMPDPLNSSWRSMQLSVVVYGTDDEDRTVYSEEVLSHIPVGNIPALQQPIDTRHKTWLIVERPSLSRPVMSSPDSNSTVGRLFTLRYNQPLEALAGSLVLQLREFPDVGGLINHRLYLSDFEAGEGKTIEINSLNLPQSDGVDSLTGPTSLNHQSRIFLSLYYTIDDPDSLPSDTGVVNNVFVDLLTESPTLIEPRIGAESPAPDIRVIYLLPEPADSVQLIFEVDTAMTMEDDPFSPHIITVVPDFYDEGEHYFTLDGTDIGTGGRNVLHSNNGPVDELVEQAIYNVTLRYGDVYANPVAVTANNGYIWPEDLTTIPPVIVEPTPGAIDNNSFWVQIDLPEEPLVGSVYLRFSAVPPYPGSPHTIHLGSLASRGITGLTLNSQVLDLSGPPVTSVDGGNSFRHGSNYLVFCGYQDNLGNEEALSSGRLVRYDGATEIPVILSPVQGDSFSFEGMEVFYVQPESATPGSLKLILEQTGGPEVDILSPHTLYLSDPDSGSQKSVMIHPAFLAPGEGIDSVQNAGSLVSRGIYKLTLAYRDNLLNAESSTFVRDLRFPSGSSVVIRGSVLNTQVIPGLSEVELMHFALTSLSGSALRGLRLAVGEGLQFEDVEHEGMILWSSLDSLLQPELDEPLDTLDAWFGGDMVWDSVSLPIGEAERHVIISGAFPPDANPADQINLILRSGDDVDCGGDPVTCFDCPIGLPDIALPVLVSSMFVEQDTTFSSLVVNWIVESEHHVLGFRLWRTDDENGINEIVATYASNEELYGRGNAASSHRYRFVDRGLRNGVTYTYSIDVVSTDGLTIHPISLSAAGSPATPPANFALNKIYPNPFNQETTIEFVVPFTETTVVTIYNILGQPVRELVNTQLPPAVYRSRWNGKNDLGLAVSSGVYIVRLKAAGRYDAAQKILLIR